ncbi:MAG TPA: hypothetical protein VL738_30585 [Dactylosporangium sp.]|nr:hypothetical protein [Dactylosporangium sp.]
MGSDVETHLIPTIGGVRLAEVTNRHLTAMFSELAATPTPTGYPRSAAMLQRVRATLRAAFNAAIREAWSWTTRPAGSRCPPRAGPRRGVDPGPGRAVAHQRRPAGGGGVAHRAGH